MSNDNFIKKLDSEFTSRLEINNRDNIIHSKLTDAMSAFSDMVDGKFHGFQRNESGKSYVVTTHAAQWKVTDTRQYWTLYRPLGDGKLETLYLTLICDYGHSQGVVLYRLLHISIPDYNVEQTVPVHFSPLLLSTLRLIDSFLDGEQLINTFELLLEKARLSLDMISKTESFGMGIISDTVGTPYHVRKD